MVSASFSPPAWQIATHVLQPNTSTFYFSFTMFQISSIGFCDPTIMINAPFHSYSLRGQDHYLVLIPSTFIASENSVQTWVYGCPPLPEGTAVRIAMRSGSIPSALIRS